MADSTKPHDSWTERDGMYARTVWANSAEQANDLDDWLSGYGPQSAERWPDRLAFVLFGVLVGFVVGGVGVMSEVSGDKDECIQQLAACTGDE